MKRNCISEWCNARWQKQQVHQNNSFTYKYIYNNFNNGQSNLAKAASPSSCRYLLSCHGRHLGFDRTGNSTIQSADPENPTLERNMKWLWWPVVMAIRNSTHHKVCISDPILGKGEVVGGNGGVLYALHCDHCAISDHSGAVCHRMSVKLKSTGGGSLWVKILWCSLWNRSITSG